MRIIKIIYTMNIAIFIFFFVILVHRSLEVIFLLCCDNKKFGKLIKLGMKILRINMLVKYSIKYCILMVHLIGLWPDSISRSGRAVFRLR